MLNARLGSDAGGRGASRVLLVSGQAPLDVKAISTCKGVIVSRPFVHPGRSRQRAVVDETTGLPSVRIIEAAVVKFAPSGKPSRFCRRAHPGNPLLADATMVHGNHPRRRCQLPFAAIDASLARVLRDSDLCGVHVKELDWPILVSSFCQSQRKSEPLAQPLGSQEAGCRMNPGARERGVAGIKRAVWLGGG